MDVFKLSKKANQLIPAKSNNFWKNFNHFTNLHLESSKVVHNSVTEILHVFIEDLFINYEKKIEHSIVLQQLTKDKEGK